VAVQGLTPQNGFNMAAVGIVRPKIPNLNQSFPKYFSKKSAKTFCTDTPL